MFASGSLDFGSPGVRPRREFSLFRAPQENSAYPVGSMEWYFQWRSLEPRALFGAPEGFIGAVGHGVGTAVIAPFDEPELEVVPDAVGAVSGRGGGERVGDGDLLAEGGDAKGVGWGHVTGGRGS